MPRLGPREDLAPDVKRADARVFVHTTHGRPTVGTLLVLVVLFVLLVLALAALMLVFLLVAVALAAAVAVLLILGTKANRTAVRELPSSHRNL
jgi:hypothetical protein